ncbi:EAL domain protein [Photobacterium marinum]|uniref:cyclic-guanylate-specific phosphodiesterase n=1 Tax=Photobacterium marinum TaxID=1056511 RepID=L8J690_9GAMM|nr:EAL domain-containing protein [Photobacterium marinum]ELR64261.1 EAL domain protein [Photobacterium marinum]
MINKIKRTYFHLGKLQLLSLLLLSTLLISLSLFTINSIHTWSQHKDNLVRQLDSLSAGIAHDLKNSLAALNNQYPEPLCDHKTMMAMQQADYFANFLTSISIVKDNLIVCSSTQGMINPPTILIEPDWISFAGVKVRQHQTVPFFEDHVTGRTAQIGNFLAYLDYSNAISEPQQPWLKYISYYNKDGDLNYLSGDADFVVNDFTPHSDGSQWYENQSWLFSQCINENECLLIAIDIPAYFAANQSMLFLWGCILVTVLILVGLLGNHVHHHLFSIPRQVRHGINDHQLTLHYQPILEMASGNIIGCEVLSRWRTQDNQWIRPDEFIAIVEQNGQTAELTEQVVLTCIRDLSKVGMLGKVKVGINAFPADIASGHIRNLLCQQLPKEYYSLFSIELTEQKIENLKALSQGVQDLRRLGFEVAIDDFGTGFSNLEALREVNVSALKIDKSFIWGAEKPSLKRSLVEHIVNIAKSLELHIIAEGVETTEQLEYLRTLDVDYTQGFLHSRPVSLEEFVVKAKQYVNTESS